MKILLTTLNAKYIHMNLAIRQLFALNRHKGGLSLKEFTIRQEPNLIAESCVGYDVVAFSCYIWNFNQTLEVARRIKALNPEIKILLGGPEVSYEFEPVIQRDEVDYIIIGEGETPFAQFIDRYPNVNEVENLVYKADGKINYKLNALPFELKNYEGVNPYQFDSKEDLKNKVCYIETSRGCPYHCAFCLASLDNKVRYLPEEQIKTNLLYLMEYGRVIKFLDRTFNVKKDFTISIFKFILEHAQPHHVFQFEITADIVHPEIVQFIDEHVPPGLFRFEIGIQTVNQDANLEVKRKQDFDKTAAVIEKLRHKIDMHLDLIVGLPLDRISDIKHSLEAVFALKPNELQLGFLKFLKGTPMRQNLAAHGYQYDQQPPYQLIESNYLSKQELQDIEKLEEALELYWNRKRGERTLRYVHSHYSIWDFLMGLGKHFDAHSDFHHHTLDDAYLMLKDFADQFAPHNPILKELIALDYYLHHQVKPKMAIVDEIPYDEKLVVIDQLKLNLHRYRFIVLRIQFDAKLYEENGEVKLGDYYAVLRFDGVNKAVLATCVPVQEVTA